MEVIIALIMLIGLWPVISGLYSKGKGLRKIQVANRGMIQLLVANPFSLSLMSKKGVDYV
jgi:hypothetical protein